MEWPERTVLQSRYSLYFHSPISIATIPRVMSFSFLRPCISLSQARLPGRLGDWESTQVSRNSLQLPYRSVRFDESRISCTGAISDGYPAHTYVSEAQGVQTRSRMDRPEPSKGRMGKNRRTDEQECVRCLVKRRENSQDPAKRPFIALACLEQSG